MIVEHIKTLNITYPFSSNRFSRLVVMTSCTSRMSVLTSNALGSDGRGISLNVFRIDRRIGSDEDFPSHVLQQSLPPS